MRSGPGVAYEFAHAHLDGLVGGITWRPAQLSQLLGVHAALGDVARPAGRALTEEQRRLTQAQFFEQGASQERDRGCAARGNVERIEALRGVQGNEDERVREVPHVDVRFRLPAVAEDLQARRVPAEL